MVASNFRTLQIGSLRYWSEPTEIVKTQVATALEVIYLTAPGDVEFIDETLETDFKNIGFDIEFLTEGIETVTFGQAKEEKVCE